MAVLVEMSNNILKSNYCYGCGVCEISCPRQLIKIKINSSGFYAPHIEDIQECNNCGLCLTVCAFIDKKCASISEPLNSYAAWSKDKGIRYRSSSGGVSFELSLSALNLGYKVIGVAFDQEEKRAKHIICSTKEQLYKTLGSKYIQSYTVESLKNINFNDKYLVIGTPCQIDSIRRYIRLKKKESNFILVDFFCHGTPSMLMWSSYLRMIKRKNINWNTVSWRNKVDGWHNSWVMSFSNGEDEKFSYLGFHSEYDLFYKFFLGHNCLGTQCYDDCKYKKVSSSADIRMGDFWGDAYKDNDAGVSSLISYNEFADNFLNNIQSLQLCKHSLPVVTDRQMSQPAVRSDNYKLSMFLLRLPLPLDIIDRILSMFDIDIFNRVKVVKSKFKRMVKYLILYERWRR